MLVQTRWAVGAKFWFAVGDNNLECGQVIHGYDLSKPYSISSEMEITQMLRSNCSRVLWCANCFAATVHSAQVRGTAVSPFMCFVCFVSLVTYKQILPMVVINENESSFLQLHS